MRMLTVGLLVVTVAALAAAEAAMQPTRRDRIMLYAVFSGMVVVTALLAAAALGWARRSSSLVRTIRIVALASVVVVGGAVAFSAATMFLSDHDLRLVTVAVGLGVGLGLVLALSVAGSLTGDLERLTTTARRVGAGDLSARTGIARSDELGQAAATFDGMIGQLAAARSQRDRDERERRELIAAIGHDLRTPLASLQAAVEALQDGVAVDPDRYLRAMAADVSHLKHLVDDLLLLASIEAGRLQLKPVDVDLSELADEAVEALAPLASRRGIRVAVDAPGRVLARLDPEAVGRALRNLLDNAVRHSPEGGGVRLMVEREPRAVTATVVDEGPGFPPELRSRAFERFARGDEARSRDRGGTGLGLAIAKGIVEGHGGEIAIEDGPGGRVRMSLPTD